jgi:DNA replication protein DnaC
MIEEIQKIKTVLPEKQSSLTEPEPYILTQEEEQAAIDHAITSQKKHLTWKMADVGMKQEQILAKLSQIDIGINREEILQRANELKHHDIWQKEQREKEKKEAIERHEALKKRSDAKYFFNLMAWTSEQIGKKLIVNESNKTLIKALCFWLSEDPRLEKELNLSFNKGLLIRGTAGVGKTHLVKCVSMSDLKPIKIYSMIDIAQEIKASGEAAMNQRGHIYLDDVGSEEATINHYGTKINWFKEFIESYYLNSRSFNRIIISTNCSFKELEDAYGFRVRSRLREMFNVIDVTGEDMRV